MTKTQKSIIKDLAHICTMLQDERTEFIHMQVEHIKHIQL